MNTKSTFDNKLIKNVIDEILRLETQLNDLEVYKNELSEEEIDSIKKETLEQLISNTKILEKMKTGDITTKTEVEDAIGKINNLLSENYNAKDLINSYLVTETVCLREKLNQVTRDFALNKIKIDEFQSSISQLLEKLAKNTTLNQDEKKLNDSIKNKVMNKYEVDQGISQNKIEQSFLNK